MRRKFRKRFRMPNVRGLKMIFSAGVTLCIIALSVTVLVRVEKNGLTAVQTNFSSAKNTLAEVATVFAGTKSISDLPDIRQIIEETNMGATSYVSKTVNNPFENAAMPVSSTEISSPYGFRESPFTGKTEFHSGVDIKAATGTEVFAVLDGTVKSVQQNDIGGLYVEIEHQNGYISYYGHLESACVNEGDSVIGGSVIAASGESGLVTGAHLHFEIKLNNRAVNPAEYFEVYAQN